MSGTLNVSPTACYVDASGIHAPSYGTILNYLIGRYQSIYGADVYLGNDSQDGQLLGVFALAISDANSATIATYNAYSPATAQGAGLSSMVKINGIRRLIPSNSNVDLTLIGQADIPIINGVAVDVNNNQWLLPSPVTIPNSGTIIVTAIAAEAGAIAAAPGTIQVIGTPTYGWQSVNNVGYANIGAPVEIDGALRQRQSVSTMLPSNAVLDGIVGAILNLIGVTRAKPYENQTSVPDFNGVPGHSIAIVVDGGSAQAIGDVILLKKTPGTGTYGTTSVTSYDFYQNPNIINFFRPSVVPIRVVITITPLANYTTMEGAAIINAVIAALISLPIGSNVVQSRMVVAAYNTQYVNYNIASLTMARGGAAQAPLDIGMSYIEAAYGDVTTVTLVGG